MFKAFNKTIFIILCDFIYFVFLRLISMASFNDFFITLKATYSAEQNSVDSSYTFFKLLALQPKPTLVIPGPSPLSKANNTVLISSKLS